jgi:uncharacterized membrane protein
MFKFRLDAVSDAVFGIVMTLLVIEFKVPKIKGLFTETALLHELEHTIPLLFAYFLSVILIVNYWYTHNFLFSLLSKNMNRTLMNLNFCYLSFISLIPFTTNLLGEYPESKTSVGLYGLLIAIISILSYIIRRYIYGHPGINNPTMKELNINYTDLVYGSVRVYIGLYGAILAVIFSLISTEFSLAIIVLQALILITPGAVGWITKILKLENMKLNLKISKIADKK